MPTEELREHPSTYVVQDRENKEEMIRLEIQDKMLNIAMGGVLPELDDPTQLRRVLDVGCGTGRWLLETANAYPMIEKLVGVDISRRMVAFAHAQAGEQYPDGQRVEFRTMDALRMLDFPPASFDLVNQRLGFSWLRTWEWKKILLEYQRICRPGGIVRITEPYLTAEYDSLALAKLYDISLQACYNAGRLFTPTRDGITSELVRLFTQHGIQNVQSQVHRVIYQAGTETGQYFCDDMARLFRITVPFFQKWAHVPKDYEELRLQAIADMQAPGFIATWTYITVWGTRPDGGLPLMRGLR